jgi:methyl-accepting chemotaxis protein
MAVQVGEAELDLILKTDAASDALRAFKEAAEIDLKLEIEKDVKDLAALTKGMKEYDEAAAKAGESGYKLSNNLNKQFKEAAKELPGLLGDLGDVVAKLGGDFLGLSESQAKAAENTLELAEKGGQIGSLFGPWGAVIGTAAGALLGLAKAATEVTISMNDAEKAAKRALEELKDLKEVRDDLRDAKKEAREMAMALRGLSDAGDLTSLLTDLGKLDAQLLQSTKTIRAQTGAMFDEALKVYRLQQAIREDNVEEIRGVLFDVIAAGIDQINEAQGGPKPLKDLKLDAKELDKELEKARKTLSRMYGELEEVGDNREAIDDLSDRIIKQKGAVDDLARAKEKADTAIKSGTASIKKEASTIQKAVTDAFSPFARVIGQVADESSDATDAMDRFVPSANKAVTALQKFTPPPGWDKFNEFFIEAGIQAENFAKETEKLTAQEDTALAVAEAWGTHALGGFEKFLDGVQAGNKIIGSMDWDEALVKFLRLTGSQLMASGLQHELAAAAAFFLGNKKDAIGLATVGAAELATGAAMGGTGALVGRRRGIGSGGGDDAPRSNAGGGGSLFGGSLSLGRGALGGGGSNTTNNSTIIINALDPSDREVLERIGRTVERARGAFRRAGGRLLDGRD